MENNVQFINDSWRFMKRSVNLNNFMILYSQEGGYKSQAAAEKAKLIADSKYESDLARIKKIANIEYTFKEYLEYCLLNVFIKETDTSTKTIGVWAVRNLILPNVEHDILLNYVTADYINDIIKRCIPICPTAGETVHKYFRKILKDVYAYGLLPKDIRDDLMPVNNTVCWIKVWRNPRSSLRRF